MVLNSAVWLLCVVLAIVMWAATSLLYKAGIGDGKEEHICLKYTVCIGFVFFVIVLACLVTRDVPFTIWESAARYWPMTAFGIVYAVVNTISINGYVYNEAMVESPVESIGCGASTILLIVAYLALGRVDLISGLLTPLRTAGILVIVVSIILLSTVRNQALRKNARHQHARWRTRGLGTLIFPVIFSINDALETIVSGICLDSTYGYGMPPGDSVIIIGMEYALFALGCWIYIGLKEGKPYNPFTRHSAPRILGATADNVGIVFYSRAMAMNSISTDPLLSVYPILAMIGGRVFLKEKISAAQYLLLLCIVAGSVLVIVGTVM